MACQIFFGGLQCIRVIRIYSPSVHCSRIDEHAQINEHINCVLLDIKLCTKCFGMMVVGVELSSAVGHFIYICLTVDCAKIRSVVVCQESPVGNFSSMIVMLFIFEQFD